MDILRDRRFSVIIMNHNPWLGKIPNFHQILQLNINTDISLIYTQRTHQEKYKQILLIIRLVSHILNYNQFSRYVYITLKPFW